jgi:hypothetical protein
MASSRRIWQEAKTNSSKEFCRHWGAEVHFEDQIMRTNLLNTMPLLKLGIAMMVLGASAMPAFADRLSGDEIRQRVTGKRIYLAAPLGGEFPLYYRTDGKVDGTGEAVGLGRLARPSDSGRWWVRGDSLCQKWQTWYDGKTMCFTLTTIGNNKLRWDQDNGDTGTARIGN